MSSRYDLDSLPLSATLANEEAAHPVRTSSSASAFTPSETVVSSGSVSASALRHACVLCVEKRLCVEKISSCTRTASH